ncbi:MAG: hypothetical protein SV760_00390, partial [Halobacteria archaeon]|nr:hypothetical protein [Halobacteria archaeon]
MKVLGAARRAFSVLAANPVIFVGSSVVSGFGFVLILAQSLGRVGIALSYGSILVNPFLMGGLYGAVEIALERSPRIDDLVSEAKTNYVDLLVVTLLVAALSFVAVFALVIAAAFVGIGYVALTSALLPSVRGSVLVFAPLVPFYLLFVIALVLAYAVFQFFDVAVVVDDETALDA